MINLSEIRAVIFDVDDTIYDTQPNSPEGGLHGRARLEATHLVGKDQGILPLQEITKQQNKDAFLNATVHTVDGAVWQTLLLVGLVNSPTLDPQNELLRQIITQKHKLYEKLIREEGTEVPGASHFILALVRQNIPLAIASGSIRRDIMIFLNKYKLEKHFPNQRIISLESVTRPKPDPEAFELAFASLAMPKIPRQNVLAMEDDQRGISAASSIGLLTCAITTRFPRNHFENQVPKPDLIVDSYAELENILAI